MRRSKETLRQNDVAWDLLRHLAKKMKPTLQHRPAIWENMLGTVYAQSPSGKVEYFDYDFAEALAFAGITKDSADIRVWREKYGSYGDYQSPRKGQWVWWSTLKVKTPPHVCDNRCTTFQDPI